jgi:hypothetical protein
VRVTGYVTLRGHRIREVRLWALAGAVGILSQIPASSAVAWLVPLPVGTLLLAALATLTWAVRRSTNPIAMRVWSAAVWAVVMGPAFLGVILLVGSVVPHSTPDMVVGMLGVVALVATSALIAAGSFEVGRWWFARRLTPMESA